MFEIEIYISIYILFPFLRDSRNYLSALFSLIVVMSEITNGSYQIYDYVYKKDYGKKLDDSFGFIIALTLN